MALRIFYDGQCPLCARFVGMARLRAAAGAVDLIDLRADGAAREDFVRRGLDPDRGMIVETAGGTFHGPDAVRALAAMTTPSGIVNRLSAALLSNRALAAGLYPLMRAGRNMLLLLLGRQPLRGADAGEAALFAIFARFLGLFAVFHVFIYYFRYAPLSPQVTTLPLLLLGLGLIFSPGSKRVFVGVVLVMLLDGWLHAPIYSNHTILKNFLTLAFLAAGLWHWLRGSAWEAFFRDVRPVGRTFLLIMYTFGIFHKINADFLDPAVSCAVALWREMPAPLVWIDTPAMHHLAIYGTFGVEAAIVLLLVVPRWRHLGIGLGIGFHALLALSGYAMYPAFSTLSIVLHTLFISPRAALAITGSALYRRLDRRINSAAGLAFLLAALLAVAFFALLRDYNMVALVWLVLVLWPAAIIVLHGRQDAGDDGPDEGHGRYFWSRLHGLNAISVLFFLSCAAPYLGLKTAQAMNMFANLRLEGGVSNHLVLRAPPGPFGYLDDLVVVTEADGSPYLEVAARNPDRALVFYHFLSVLESAPEARVSYLRGGVPHTGRLAGDILAAEGAMLHPGWMRKFFHFRPVSVARPTRCD